MFQKNHYIFAAQTNKENVLHLIYIATMKRRLNILCGLVFAVIAIGLIPVFYSFGMGFGAGFHEDKAGDDTNDLEQMLNAQTVHLCPSRMDSLQSGTIRNAVSGEEVHFWPERVMADVVVDYPTWYVTTDKVMLFLAAAALIAILVLFLKLIVRVNKGRVFEWKNVRLLRWLGSIIFIASLLTTLLQIYGASVINEQFAVNGFKPDYFSYVSVMELTVGLVALIVAEIFAVGLKMKEEQELTI